MSEYKTIEEERAALVKRIEEIDAEASFKPGLYVKWDNYVLKYCICEIDNAEMYKHIKSAWDHVEPFHLVAHKFLPKGWRVVGPDECD